MESLLTAAKWRNYAIAAYISIPLIIMGLFLSIVAIAGLALLFFQMKDSLVWRWRSWRRGRKDHA